MPEIERELGAIGAHLTNIDAKLGEIVVQTTATNGRLRDAEAAIAVLQDRQADVIRIDKRVGDMEERPRNWLFAFGGPVVASLIVLLGSHVH